MAESSSASTSYGSNSTSFANLSDTEAVGSDCDLGSGEVFEAELEGGPSTKIVSLYVSCNMCIQL